MDPCGGRGGLVVYFLKQAKEKGIDIDINKVYYNDVDTNMVSFFKQVNKEYDLGIPEINITSEDFSVMEFKMKFDVVITNPPYLGKKALHQQFFNLAVDLVKDDGDVVFIQPATVYFNKKEYQKNAVKTMISHLENYIIDVEILGSEIFENASVANDLAITHLKKTKSNTKNIDAITYKNGDKYTNVPLKNISQTRMHPDVYESISNKIKTYISKHGSLQDVLETDENKIKAKIAKIRGVSGPESPMWYSLMPRDKKYWGTDSDYGIAVKNQQEVDNAYEYFKTYIARFGLAMSKFTANHHMGELRTVPLVDFSKIYTDIELCALMGISELEFSEIKKVIKPYYE